MLSYYNTVREKRKRKNNIKKEIKTIKTYNNIFNDICSTENLIRAHKNARRDKSYYSSV